MIGILRYPPVYLGSTHVNPGPMDLWLILNVRKEW